MGKLEETTIKKYDDLALKGEINFETLLVYENIVDFSK